MTSSSRPDYRAWSNTELIDRVTSLESQLRTANALHSKLKSCSTTVPAPQLKKNAAKRQFDPSKYNTRYIALKFAYLGQGYNGFEYHANTTTRLPTIEEELWKALAKTKLIFPTAGTDGEIDWEGCEYSKCGRTDKGVSAFGQVIALRVRSARPTPKSQEVVSEDSDESDGNDEELETLFDDIRDELGYTRMLNRVLPDTIRVLAWCPAPNDQFSARFSCRERRYRYFFTQPAFVPRPGQPGLGANGKRDGWLDIDAMREAAKHFEGLHDFRNFCRVDGSKQLTTFERRVFSANIEESKSCSSMPNFVSQPEFVRTSAMNSAEDQARVYCFVVTGSAFLWHQVRHMVAILFLVGQGFEKPSIVETLLDITSTPSKPNYEMADDAPLVLWDCIFPNEIGDRHQDSLPWVYPEDQINNSSAYSDGRYGPGATNEVVWSNWRRSKIDEILAGTLMDLVANQGLEKNLTAIENNPNSHSRPVKQSAKVFDGGNNARLKGDYVPLLQRERMDTVEVQNHRYAARKGLLSANGLTKTHVPVSDADE